MRHQIGVSALVDHPKPYKFILTHFSIFIPFLHVPLLVPPQWYTFLPVFFSFRPYSPFHLEQVDALSDRRFLTVHALVATAGVVIAVFLVEVLFVKNLVRWASPAKSISGTFPPTHRVGMFLCGPSVCRSIPSTCTEPQEDQAPIKGRPCRKTGSQIGSGPSDPVQFCQIAGHRSDPVMVHIYDCRYDPAADLIRSGPSDPVQASHQVRTRYAKLIFYGRKCAFHGRKSQQKCVFLV